MTVCPLIAADGDFLISAAIAALLRGDRHRANFAGDRAVSYPAALVFCAALAWRRRAPLVTLAIAVVIIELSEPGRARAGGRRRLGPGRRAADHVLKGRRCARGRAFIVAIALVVFAIPLAAIEPGNPTTTSDIAFFVVLFGGPLFVGRYLRHRREREHALEGRAEQLAIERDTRAGEAVAQERTRIARELHDVVAHAISVMVLQARGGRRMLADDPGETRRALDTIEHAGEQALRRDAPAAGPAAPAGERAVAGAGTEPEPPRRAGRGHPRSGLPVEMAIEGEPVELPPGVDVSAYRIVQGADQRAQAPCLPKQTRASCAPAFA